MSGAYLRSYTGEYRGIYRDLGLGVWGLGIRVKECCVKKLTGSAKTADQLPLFFFTALDPRPKDPKPEPPSPETLNPSP